MLSFTVLASILLGASAVTAYDVAASGDDAAESMSMSTMHQGKCDVSTVDVSTTFPSGQTQLQGQMNGPDFIGLGVGVQNYTCNQGTYTLVGAVAQIFDISCLNNQSIFVDVAVVAFNAWSEAHMSITAQELKLLDLPFNGLSYGILNENSLLGLHFFVKNESAITGIPAWDFSASQNNSDAFVDVAAFEKLPAPQNVTDVPWLQVHGTTGNLATSVYRLFTRGGQPPASCGPRDPTDISVKYTSQYWFFGASF